MKKVVGRGQHHSLSAFAIFAVLASLVLALPAEAKTPVAFHFPAAQSWMTINGKSIVVDNISGASNQQVNGLVAVADGVTASCGIGCSGLMQQGDRVIVTQDYIAWIDNTHNTTSLPGDQWAGGMLRGIWHLTGSGGNLNFRTDGAWNELLPYYYNAGTGYQIFLNENPGCADTGGPGVWTSAGQPTPATTIDGGASPFFSGGVRYQYQGNMYNSTNNTDNVGGGDHMQYTVTYDFGPTYGDIIVTTSLTLNGSTTIPAYCITQDYDMAAAWTAGYGVNNNRVNRLNTASFGRNCVQSPPQSVWPCPGPVGANTWADLPNNVGLTGVTYWISQPGSNLGAGATQQMQEWPYGSPPRFLAQDSATINGSVNSFQDVQAIYNKPDNAYSMTWNVIHDAGTPTYLSPGWGYNQLSFIWTM
ncbi:MAG TPA: hypothetical protein VFW71_00095 [Actinomycetota bacterium]|nr:hypothetical protein [Actinomycetota bacterium]